MRGLENLTAGLVLGAAAAILLLLVGYPLLWLVMGAVGLPGPPTAEHLLRVYGRAQNFTPFVNTLVLALGSGLVALVLGVPLAWATARTDMPARRLVQALIALAYITPPYLTALAYIILMGPDAGYLNRLVVWLTGLERGPFDIFSMAGIVFVIGLHVMAFPYFLTYGALRAIDAPLEESARMLGAGGWTVAQRITLPLVAPAITGGALLAAIDSMALFGPQAFLGLPAQLVFLPTRIYGLLGSYPPRFGDAAALSLVLVLLTVLGLMVQRLYLDRRSHVTVGGKGVRTQRSSLGLWRWPALAACLTILLFAAVAPLAVLTTASFSRSWIELPLPGNLTFAHYGTALFENQVAVRGIINSFGLATAAAAIAVTLGLLVAYLDLRTRLPGRRLLDYLAILPLGLPGTVMAVGVLLASIRPPLVLYGTIWILLVAYVARFVPLAVRSANGALRQIDPSLEEAARIAGASWLQSLQRIVLPLVRPGLIAAFLLVFIPALGELSATILLYSSGTETIAVAIYRLNDLGQLEVVCALAVFTTAIILAVSLLLDRLGGAGKTAAVELPAR